MIFQNFNRSSGQQLNYGRYDYVPGASIIFDWGNPASYNPGQGASGVTSNIGSGSTGEPQALFFGATTDMWSSAYGGSISFNYANSQYVQWNGTFTAAVSTVMVYKMVDSTGAAGAIPSLKNYNGVNLVLNNTSRLAQPTIYYGSAGSSSVQLSCNVTLPNNWCVTTFATNGTNSHIMYLDSGVTSSIDTGTYDRTLYTPVAQNIVLGRNKLTTNYSNGNMIAYLQYPFQLTKAQVRQIYLQFRQSFS
jgi:hypothetical protein